MGEDMTITVAPWYVVIFPCSRRFVGCPFNTSLHARRKFKALIALAWWNIGSEKLSSTMTTETNVG